MVTVNTFMRIGGAVALLGGTALSMTMTPFKYDTELCQQAIDLVERLEQELTVARVTAPNALSTDPAAYSTGVLPDANTLVIVEFGAHFTIVANSDYTSHTTAVYGSGEVMEGDAPSVADWQPDGTREFMDTLIVFPSGSWTRGQGGEGIIRRIVDTSTDIDVSVDPTLISRGNIILGTMHENGHERQRALPILNDLIAGVTDTLVLGRAIHLGGPAGRGAMEPLSRDDSQLPLVLNPGDRCAIAQNIGKATINTEIRANEIVQLASANIQFNATPFSTLDPTGTTVTLSAPVQANHSRIPDTTTLSDMAIKKGPPQGSPKHGSHEGHFGRPVLEIMARSLIYEVSDKSQPAHRQPTYLEGSSGFDGLFFGLKNWGRTNIRAATVIPGDVENTPTTNLRRRSAFQFINTGHQFAGYWRTYAHTAYLRGLAIWDDTVGVPDSNGTRGDASYSCGIGTFNAHFQIEDCSTFNTTGSGFLAESTYETGEVHNSAFQAVASMSPLGEAPPVSKSNQWYSTGDLGRSGTGMDFMSRSVLLFRNRTSGNVREGFDVISRGPVGEVQDFDVRCLPFGPETVAFDQRLTLSSEIDDKPPLFVEGHYSAGNNGRGFVVAKNGPSQGHGISAIFINCVSIANGSAQMSFQYTGNYVLVSPVCIGHPTEATPGIQLDVGSFAFSIVDPYIRLCSDPIEYKTKTAQGDNISREDLDHHVVNADDIQNNTGTYRDKDDNGIQLYFHTIAREANGEYLDEFGFEITGVDYADGTPVFSGRSRDALGVRDAFPYATPTQDRNISVSIPHYKGLLANYGYHTNTDGSGPGVFTSQPMTQTSRLTGKRRKVLVPCPRNSLPGSDNFRWTDEAGALLPYPDNGAASYTAAMAAANAAANPHGLSFAA